MTEKERFLTERITNDLIKVGVPVNLQGFRFLRDALFLVIEDPEILQSVTKKLYPTIGMHFDVSASVVERGIRHALEVAYNKCYMSGINEMFGVEICNKRYKPTNSETIALIAEKIILDMNNDDTDPPKNDDKDDKNNKKGH